MTKEHLQSILHFSVTELFYVLLVTFGFFSFLETVIPGFVSYAINIDALLIFTLVTGVLGFGMPFSAHIQRIPKKAERHSRIRAVLFVGFVSVVCGLFLYLKVRGQDVTTALVLGVASSVLVAIIALTALTEDEIENG